MTSGGAHGARTNVFQLSQSLAKMPGGSARHPPVFQDCASTGVHPAQLLSSAVVAAHQPTVGSDPRAGSGPLGSSLFPESFLSSSFGPSQPGPSALELQRPSRSCRSGDCAPPPLYITGSDGHSLNGRPARFPNSNRAFALDQAT